MPLDVAEPRPSSPLDRESTLFDNQRLRRLLAQSLEDLARERERHRETTVAFEEELEALRRRYEKGKGRAD